MEASTTHTATVDEAQLSRWTAPAFDNEDEKRRATEVEIRAAIDGHPLLSRLPIQVYAKGSYKNNTNVRRDSDVDVAVEYTGILMFEYGDGTSREEVWAAEGITPYSGPFVDAGGSTDLQQFKNAVGGALEVAFGPSAVTRRNKVFTVRESDRSLAADIVPCATHRTYWTASQFSEGIQLLPDRPAPWSTQNYPEQHYNNGVSFNELTSRRYKSVVRILKNLENKMVADGAIEEVPSYLIESLVFNAPASCFSGATWAQRVRSVLAHIWEDTAEPECEQRWLEVNGIKYLFHVRQKWTRDEARAFVLGAWPYVKDS